MRAPKGVPQPHPGHDRLLAAIQAEHDAQEVQAASVASPLKARFVAVSGAASKWSAALVTPLLAIKKLPADTINDLSLEHFFNRVIEFIVILAVLLARLPWPLAFTSAAFARACTGAAAFVGDVGVITALWRFHRRECAPL